VLHRPGRVLDGLIEKFWFASKHASGTALFEILPDGNFDVVFILDDAGCHLLFVGPYTRRTVVRLLPDTEYFGVSFRAGRMPCLADIHPADLIDTMIDLPELAGISSDQLGEGLRRSREIEAKQAYMEMIFKEIRLESRIRPDLCSRCTDIVASRQGRIKVHDLASRAGVSVRTLERTFLRDLGIPPKMFTRLVRFHSAVEQLKNGDYPSLTHLAYQCGYADQAHFIKDFQELAGRPPGSM
jgi:AraC-like DNA-binding protein